MDFKQAIKRVCLKASSVYVWSPQACMNVCLISQKSLGFKNPLENALLEHSCSLFWSCVRGGTLEKPSSMYVCMFESLKRVCMHVCLNSSIVYVCMFEAHKRVCLKASSVYVWACMFERVCLSVYVCMPQTYIHKPNIHTQLVDLPYRKAFQEALERVCMFKNPLPVMKKRSNIHEKHA